MQNLIEKKPPFIKVERVHETIYRALPLIGTKLKVKNGAVKTSKGSKCVLYNNLTGRLWSEVDKTHLGAYNVIDNTLMAETSFKNWKVYQGQFVSDWGVHTKADEQYFTGVYSFSVDGCGGSRLFDDFEDWVKFNFSCDFEIDLRRLIVDKRYILEVWVQKVCGEYVVLSIFYTDNKTEQYRGMGAEYKSLCLFDTEHKVSDFELDTRLIYQRAVRELSFNGIIEGKEVDLVGGLTPMLRSADLFSVSGTREFIKKCQYAKQLKELWFDCTIMMTVEPNGIMVVVPTYRTDKVDTKSRKCFVSLNSLYGN